MFSRSERKVNSMITKRIFCIAVIGGIICLTACGNSNNNSENNSSAVVVSAVGSRTNSLLDSRVTLQAEAVAYDNGQLTFVYDGKEYTLAMDSELFEHDEKYVNGKSLSQAMINNDIGEVISAEIVTDEGITKIYSCDVVSPNGEKYASGMYEDIKADVPAEEYDYKLCHKSGSVYELSNANRTITADFNDLEEWQKGKYPESADDVMFGGYLFTDGKFIIEDINLLVAVNDDGSKTYEPLTTSDYPSFFGTVQTIGDNTAEIKLTDGKTVCTVPTYYCDGELSEGLEVMVILDCSTDLFDSGKSESFDYAVICTDPAEYDPSGHEFGNLAYAKADSNNLGRFIYTEIGDIEK